MTKCSTMEEGPSGLDDEVGYGSNMARNVYLGWESVSKVEGL